MAFPEQGILDGFTGVDQTPITTNWTCPLFAASGLMKRISNTLRGQGLNSNGYWNAGNVGPDCECYLTIVTPGLNNEELSLVARIVSEGTSNIDGYLVRLITQSPGNDIVRIRSLTNDVTTGLGADILTEDFQAGDGFGISVVGTTITAYRRIGGVWSSIGSRTDATYAGAGKIGVAIQGTTFVLDDFGGGTIGTGQTILPDGDLATTGWTTAPLFSKVNDSSDATVISATAA